MSQFLAPTAQGSSPTTTAAAAAAATADGSHPLPNRQPWLIVGLGNPGGHGGHNGMKNIIDCFKGSRDFPHLRIGIGRPPGKIDAANFVLHPFTKQEHQELDLTFQEGVEAVRILLLEGLDKSATFVNSARTMEQLG